jgi:hypothetical protein
MALRIKEPNFAAAPIIEALARDGLQAGRPLGRAKTRAASRKAERISRMCANVACP